MGHILNSRFNQEVELARDKVALFNLGDEFDRVGKRFKGIACRPLQCHLNENNSTGIQFGGGQARVVARNHTLTFQALNPIVTG